MFLNASAEAVPCLSTPGNRQYRWFVGKGVAGQHVYLCLQSFGIGVYSLSLYSPVDGYSSQIGIEGSVSRLRMYWLVVWFLKGASVSLCTPRSRELIMECLGRCSDVNAILALSPSGVIHSTVKGVY